MPQTDASQANPLSPICRHHWVIDTPNGNSSEDLLWDNDSFSLNGTRYKGRRREETTSRS
jgi:hypothetical protein